MNSYGKLFRITLYGESHQPSIGVVIDGVNPGMKLDLALINDDLTKRRPGAKGTTPRVEADLYEITSGIYNGVTTGSPINLIIRNTNVVSKDYNHLLEHPRPGHTDLVAKQKYHQYNDHRGGGRFSGRLTAALVAAGAIAKQMIPFKFSNKITQIGDLEDLSKIDDYLTKISQEGDSVGGTIELNVTNMIAGLGEPFFYKLEGEIGKMMMSIPAVKGVMVGTSFDGKHLKGSEFNDLIIDEHGKTKTNNSGGVSGGISNSNDLVIKVFVKPTSSISKPQETYNLKEGKIKTLQVEGRHDTAIIRRVGIVLENALAIVLADMYLLHIAYNGRFN